MRFLPSIICPGFMSCGREQKSVFSCLALIAAGLLFFSPSPVHAAEEFSFDVDELEKKNFEWGGYAELKWEHMYLNEGSAFEILNPSKPSGSTLDRLSGTLQIDGSYLGGITSLNWTLKASGQQDNLDWYDQADIFEAYVGLKPTPRLAASLGKKSYKWGKGYAWNPAGFLNRPKDPDDPEEALEGYTTVELDLVKSFAGKLQTAALTTVILPVWNEINEEFGEINNVNLAVKLYLLYKDTDIDLIYYTGNSRSSRYGLDFAKNLAANFEIHGELAYLPNQETFVLQKDGSTLLRERSALSGLIGLRYLSENNITSIIEYYHNDSGYSTGEMDRFYQLVVEGENQLYSSGSDLLLDQARDVSRKGYGRPQSGRNYLYGRFTQQEPFDILYFTPGLITIYNLDDLSFSISPEILYTGFTNWEMRLRCTFREGSSFTEYDEKLTHSKLELRLRYFF
ncbi:hypothetical protein HRM2_39220 [Desulforapulum autotrophicum HRM2]|uniref:Porin n=2 Tax=Desulforapulum autotrophicum TaxID=2296 RepID=C0QBH8_DESAH|nr:hypothetical protein HRM2_39220 [Desulforapulum autotrophicum HRM2]